MISIRAVDYIRMPAVLKVKNENPQTPQQIPAQTAAVSSKKVRQSLVEVRAEQTSL